MQKLKIKAVFFDLDGTILDSSRAIYNSLKYLSKKYNFTLKSEIELQPYYGDGLRALLKLHQIDNTLMREKVEELIKEGFEYYIKNSFRWVKAYDEFDKVIDFLNENNIMWGIITNKTRNLMESNKNLVYKIESAKLIVCQDDLPHKKPHPLPLIYSCNFCNISFKNMVYVGDSLVDIKSCENSNIFPIFAKYGYSNELIKKEVYNKKIKCIDNFNDLYKWLTFMI